MRKPAHLFFLLLLLLSRHALAIDDVGSGFYSNMAQHLINTDVSFADYWYRDFSNPVSIVMLESSPGTLEVRSNSLSSDTTITVTAPDNKILKGNECQTSPFCRAFYLGEDYFGAGSAEFNVSISAQPLPDKYQWVNLDFFEDSPSANPVLYITQSINTEYRKSIESNRSRLKGSTADIGDAVVSNMRALAMQDALVAVTMLDTSNFYNASCGAMEASAELSLGMTGSASLEAALLDIANGLGQLQAGNPLPAYWTIVNSLEQSGVLIGGIWQLAGVENAVTATYMAEETIRKLRDEGTLFQNRTDLELISYAETYVLPELLSSQDCSWISDFFAGCGFDSDYDQEEFLKTYKAFSLLIHNKATGYTYGNFHADVDGDGLINSQDEDPNDPNVPGISSGNLAPIAAINPSSVSVDIGTVVTLDGTSSYDPDEDDAINGSYSWVLITPEGSSATLSSENSGVVSFAPDLVGSYTVSLTVSDGDLSGTKTVSIAATKVYSEPELIEIQEGRFAYTNIYLNDCELKQIATLTVPSGEIWNEVTFATSRGIDVVLLVDDDELPSKDGSLGCPNYTQEFDSDKEYDLYEQGGFPDWTKDLYAGDRLRLAVFSYEGISNYQFTVDITIDKDADGDDVPDDKDDFPNNPSEQYDSDGDGVGNNTDKFDNDPAASIDTDDDGYPDGWNIGRTKTDSTTGLELDHPLFVNDSTEWADSDGDGVGDNADHFDDDDAASIDSDEDGYPDSWNSGKTESDSTTGLRLDKFINDAAAAIDDDNDYHPDRWNTGKTVADSTTGLIIDLFPDDPTEWADSDYDGVGDNTDAFDYDYSEWADTDSDGVGDNTDAAPNDPSRTTNTSPSLNQVDPTLIKKNESLDIAITATDADGDTIGLSLIYAPDFVSLWNNTLTISPSETAEIGEYKIIVKANDDFSGVAYTEIMFTVTADTDGDGLIDNVEDVNQNGIVDEDETDPNDADTDDDGIPDGTEDANQNGTVDAGETDPCNPDTDNDGIQDGTEIGLTTADVGPDTDLGIFQPDLDPSTTTNPLLNDSDGDGLLDGEEDLDGNGRMDAGESDPNASSRSIAMPWIPLLLLNE